MKKIFRLIAALAATTIAFSCMEEANPETPATDDATGTHYDGPMTTLEFLIDELETKTAWDGENHTWSEGDQIKIIWGTEDDAFTVAEVVDGTVTATVGDVSIYYAVYPATAEHMFSTPEGASEAKFSVRIPRNQDGSFETANLMSAETTKEERSFNFKNLTHIIKFNLNAGHGFDEIEFCANSEDIITGRHFVDITNAEVVIEYNKDGNTNSKYITVKGLESQSGDFYVGLVPDADMSTGIMLRAKKKGEEYKYSAISRTDLTTTRSAITKIGNIGNYLRENIWYIAPDCTGDGSETNPAGISKLIELLKKIEFANGSTSKTVNWRLCNAVINVAPGTYNIPEANNGANFKPNGLTKDCNLTIIGDEGTIFTTIEKENVRIFHFDGIAAGRVTFDGITFQGTGETAVASVGVATYCNNSTTGTFTYNNCTFKNFNNNNSTSGVAILSNNDGERTLNFIDCTFENNTSLSNGIIVNNGSKTTFNVENCTFRNNKAKNGGAIYAGAGTTNVEGCTFSSNSATGNGGAVYLGTANVSIDFMDCQFSKNSATIGGVAYCTKGTLSFKGCEFSENKSTSYGATLANSVGVLIVDECAFSANTNTTEGGAIFSYGETTGTSNVKLIEGITDTYVYNTLFDGNTATSQGSAIKVHGNTNLVVVNSTFTNGIANNGTIRLRAEDRKATAVPNVKAWIISCTFSGNNKFSLYNQSCTAYLYNSILNDPTSYNANQPAGSTTFNKCILYNTDYINIKEGALSGTTAVSTLTDKTTLTTTVVGSFANGVFPVTGAALTDGMSSTDLAALGAEGSALLTAMPLFDASKLTVDQKGNSREGKTIMGAYVGE